VPRAWQTVREGATTVVLAPSPPLRDRVLVTVEPADHVSLIARSLRARIHGITDRPRTADVAGRVAWQYAGLVGRRGTEALDVTVLPTRDAVVNIACLSPIRDAAAMPDCAASIHSVALGGAPTLVPAPDLALQLRLPPTLAVLDRTRRQTRAALGRAPRGATQARLARRLAAAHADAADALRPVAGAGGASLIDELTASADAYRALAGAVGSTSAARLRAARGAVRASDERLPEVVGAVARRPLVSAVTPARAPVSAATGATRPGWLLLVIGLSAVLVFLLVTWWVQWLGAPRPAVHRLDPPPPDPRPPAYTAAEEHPGARPAPARWDAPPPSLSAPPEDSSRSSAATM
jgi:hypothetical protein